MIRFVQKLTSKWYSSGSYDGEVLPCVQPITSTLHSPTLFLSRTEWVKQRKLRGFPTVNEGASGLSLDCCFNQRHQQIRQCLQAKRNEVESTKGLGGRTLGHCIKGPWVVVGGFIGKTPENESESSYFLYKGPKIKVGKDSLSSPRFFLKGTYWKYSGAVNHFIR